MGCSIAKKHKSNSSTASLSELTQIQQQYTKIQQQYKVTKVDRKVFSNQVPILSSINESSIILRRKVSKQSTNSQ